jgi:L-fucose isomerase-like protein
MEKKFGIAPCLVMSDFIENGIPAACELDIDNAIMMRALQIASERPVMLMDVNNNYGNEENKTILFHCSAVPTSFLKAKGCVSEHKMFKKSYGDGSGVGVLNGDIVTDEDVTISSLKTENGKLCSFVCEGKLTNDEIEKAFFGCGTVFETANTKNLLNFMCENGFRHHVAIAHGLWGDAVKEALEKYLNFVVEKI